MFPGVFEIEEEGAYLLRFRMTSEAERLYFEKLKISNEREALLVVKLRKLLAATVQGEDYLDLGRVLTKLKKELVTTDQQDDISEGEEGDWSDVDNVATDEFDNDEEGEFDDDDDEEEGIWTDTQILMMSMIV